MAVTGSNAICVTLAGIVECCYPRTMGGGGANFKGLLIFGDTLLGFGQQNGG